MKLIKNTGDNRVIDELRATLSPACTLDIASPALSLFAFSEIKNPLDKISRCRLVVPTAAAHEPALLGGDADRQFRNQLNARAVDDDPDGRRAAGNPTRREK